LTYTSADPPTWHYGLVARYWAEVNEPAGDREVAFFRTAIERFGQPALDLGCGTGRILVPLLRAGIEVDGCDISGDMIEWCAKAASADGFSPCLSVQPMQDLAPKAGVISKHFRWDVLLKKVRRCHCSSNTPRLIYF
jgi:SAM-dependent methyltransferase